MEGKYITVKCPKCGKLQSLYSDYAVEGWCIMCKMCGHTWTHSSVSDTVKLVYSCPIGSIIKVECKEEYERGTYLSNGIDGVLHEVLYDEWVIAVYNGNGMATALNPFKYAGFWKKIDCNKEQFYYDKYHPSNRYREYKVVDYVYIDDCSTINELTNKLNEFDSGLKVKLDDEGVAVYMYNEWEDIT